MPTSAHKYAKCISPLNGSLDDSRNKGKCFALMPVFLRIGPMKSVRQHKISISILLACLNPTGEMYQDGRKAERSRKRALCLKKWDFLEGAAEMI